MRLSWVAIAALGLVEVAHGEAEPSALDSPGAGTKAPKPSAPVAPPRFAVESGETDTLADVVDENEEVIEIWAEREERPFDRDTRLRMTGRELRERGLTTLDNALDLIPELRVRAMGRGGNQVNIRGARKGSVKVLIDGVPLADPYFGTVDISNIPVTDIAEIRVSASPASPIDGVGGPGGVIEVHTFDAIGKPLARFSMAANTNPVANFAVTARSGISDHVAARLSLFGSLAQRTLLDETGGLPALDQDAQAATGVLRLEYQKGKRRAALDAWLGQKSYIVPHGTDSTRDVSMIDGEASRRVALSASDEFGKWRVDANTYVQTLERMVRYFDDQSLLMETGSENVDSIGFGSQAVASRLIGNHFSVVGSTAIQVDDATFTRRSGETEGGRSGAANIALGGTFVSEDFDIRFAAGVAVPIAVGSGPWPEGKLTAYWIGSDRLKIKTELALKGRSPTIREFFQARDGNNELAPERFYTASVGAEYAHKKIVTAEIDTFVRRVYGLLRFDLDQDQLINLGQADFIGVDTQLRVYPKSIIGGEASYSYVRAEDRDLGADPLDFLPRHRADIGITSRSRYLNARIRARMLSDQIDASEIVPASLTLHAEANAIFDRYQFSLRFDDILDRRPLVRSGGVFAAGRTLWVSMSAQWD